MSHNPFNLPGSIVITDGGLERAISDEMALHELVGQRDPQKALATLYSNPHGYLHTGSGALIKFVPEKILPTRGPIPLPEAPDDVPAVLLQEVGKIDAMQMLRLKDRLPGLPQGAVLEALQEVATRHKVGLLPAEKDGVLGWWSPEELTQPED